MSKTKLNTHCDSLGKKKSYFGLVLSVLTRAVISVIPKHWSPLERFQKILMPRMHPRPIQFCKHGNKSLHLKFSQNDSDVPPGTGCLSSPSQSSLHRAKCTKIDLSGQSYRLSHLGPLLVPSSAVTSENGNNLGNLPWPGGISLHPQLL